MNMETKEMTFESAIARLEEIVRTLENGSEALDTSLSLFEEGIALVKLCNSKLDTAEQKIKILVGAPDGTMEEQNFSAEREQ